MTTMRIDRLLPPSEPGRFWTVALEGGGFMRVPEGAVADFSLYSGMELETETFLRLKEAAQEGALREYAANALTRGPLSAGVLREKLEKKGADPVLADRVVTWAQRIGLVNDGEYANALARHYAAKGYGIYKIKNELYRRKVPRVYWDEALALLDDPAEQIQAFLEKKLTDPTDRKQVKKVSDALARRGYSWRQISEAMERLRWDWEDNP